MPVKVALRKPKPDPTWDLDLPAEFDIKPDHTIQLPEDNVAHVYAYEWPAGVEDKPEQMLKGWRIEYFGKFFGTEDTGMMKQRNPHLRQSYTKLRLPHEVRDNLLAVTKAILAKQQHSMPDHDHEDVDD
jgi:hypothetical protein